MNTTAEEEVSLGRDEVLELREMAEIAERLSIQNEEIQNLNKELRETSCKLSSQEMENESLRRQIERSDSEYEVLLRKFDAACESVRTYGENEKILREEQQTLKEQTKSLRDSVMECNKARDTVIEKLKCVSLETRELIDNCEKATEESKLFRMQMEELEKELNSLKHLNGSLQIENRSLQRELETRALEVLSLQHKLSFFNSESGADVKDLWKNDVLVASSELREIEQQIQTIIGNLNDNAAEKVKLKVELERLRRSQRHLQEQNVMKDEIISKLNGDFSKVNVVVDEYHSEILRLDGQLKDCHERVAALNENLETINSESFDVTAFTIFKQSVGMFGGLDNVECLLSKLQALYEIEQFFEKNLSLHVEPFGGEPESDASATVTQEDAINRIKNYLEKAVSVIENLNDKMTHLRSEYESKLKTKSAEISTLREVLSNTTLYNKMLEQTLQQYKDNVQFDKPADNETDELLTVNETLLDGFDTLKQLYRISERSNCFLYAKSEQLKLCCNLLKIFTRQLDGNGGGAVERSENVDAFRRKAGEVLFLTSEIFEEIGRNEPSARRLLDSQQLIDKCDKNLMSKDNLKNTVENMSQEVKRLTSKVEHEISEKIREIESLKGEIDNVKTDNRQLVNKIKHCNREIISLSTENYDLNEKLEYLTKIENGNEAPKREVENVKRIPAAAVVVADVGRAANSEGVTSVPKLAPAQVSLKNVSRMCLSLKNENLHLKQSTTTFFREFSAIVFATREQLQLVVDRPDRTKDIVDLRQTCSLIAVSQKDLKGLATQFQQTVSNDLSALRAILAGCQNSAVNKNDWLLKSGEELRKRVVSSTNSTASDASRPPTPTSQQSHFVGVDSLVELPENCEKNVSTDAIHIAGLFREARICVKSIRSFVEEMMVELLRDFQAIAIEIQTAAMCIFESMKSSFALSNEEMIREMQEMNTELKKRGEDVADLTQLLSDVEKEKNRLLEQLKEKENVVLELKAKMVNYEKWFGDKDELAERAKRDLEDVKTRYSSELNRKTEQLESLSAELETMSCQMRCKDETIASLKTEMKLKDAHDGDVSSVGTISRTEEVSRLSDVEDSFEERYTKLRVLAVRMKKSIADLNQKLKNEKADRAALQNKLSAVSDQVKTSQALQEECDKLADELEIRMNEVNELKKIIRESDETNESMKQRCGELCRNLEVSEKTIATLQAERLEVETKLKAFVVQVENVNQEKLAEEIVKKEKDREIHRLKLKLKENEDVKRRVQNDLDLAKLEVRKQGALSLEMEDYEKTISDLTTQVADKHSQIEDLNRKLSCSTDDGAVLVTRIKQLEDQVISYIVSNKTADEQILALNKTVAECERNSEERNQRLKQTILMLEAEKSKHERLSIQYATSTSEIKSLTESFRSKEVVFNEQIKSLQLKLVSAEETLKKKENEFNRLKDDFEAYKVRAHNVLQKRKSEHNAKNNEEKLQSEIDALGQTMKELRKRLEDTLVEMDNQNVELKFMEESKEKLQKRVKELSEVVVEKAEELEVLRAEQKAYKLSTDTLVNCYKVEVEKLKSYAETLRIETKSIKSEEKPGGSVENLIISYEKNSDRGSTDENEVACNLSGGSHDSELEGIDEAKTYGKVRKHSVVPLDKLLETNGAANRLFSFSSVETELRQNIKTLEEQVKYLTKLLNESEKNAARNEQQVVLCKEEIRRLQRMFEREPHLQNTEYLKNVLLKFVSLPLGDEKFRLVTVLETILKLSPNEKEMLSAIAKGHRPDQKQAAGWTSFLGWP